MQQENLEASRRQAQRMADGCLGVRVGRLHRVVSRRFDAELRPLGLTLPQLEVLAALALNDLPVRPSEIAGWLGLERSTVSRNLDALTKHGLVVAVTTSATGRTTGVQITDTGSQALAGAEDAWHRAQASIGDAFGPDAVPVLDRWLGGLLT